MIVNNGEYYYELIKNGFNGGHLNRRDMYFLAREWYSQGKSKQTVADMLIDYCRKWVKEYNYAKYENLVVEIIESLEKQPQNAKRKSIGFSEAELKKTDDLEDENLRKVYFVLMAIAKMYGGEYVYINQKSTVGLKEVFSLAKVNLSKNNQLNCLHRLYKQGYISVDIKPLCRYRINHMCDETPLISFEPNSEMVLEYDKYRGIPMIYCSNCGKLVKKTNNKIKYCKKCAIEINIQKTIENRLK